MKIRRYSNKLLKIVVALAFGALFVLTPLLHNHAPDIIDHEDCPSYLLSMSLLAYVLIISPVWILLHFIHSIIFPLFQLKSVSLYKTFSNRAPPTLSEINSTTF